MKHPVYSVRDRHVGFMSPMVDQNDNTAIRNFKHAVMKEDSLYHSAAKDFSLYKIAEFDSETGLLSPLAVPELVIDAFSLVEE